MWSIMFKMFVTVHLHAAELHVQCKHHCRDDLPHNNKKLFKYSTLAKRAISVENNTIQQGQLETLLVLHKGQMYAAKLIEYFICSKNIIPKFRNKSGSHKQEISIMNHVCVCKRRKRSRICPGNHHVAIWNGCPKPGCQYWTSTYLASSMISTCV